MAYYQLIFIFLDERTHTKALINYINEHNLPIGTKWDHKEGLILLVREEHIDDVKIHLEDLPGFIQLYKNKAIEFEYYYKSYKKTPYADTYGFEF
uniref:Superoxide dismutase n=1 Tax=Strongyloides venezuelensis TaxID=75913 RepID=A0A0K0FPM2_STRVS